VEGYYEKRNALPKREKMRQTGRGALRKMKCPPCPWMKK